MTVTATSTHPSQRLEYVGFVDTSAAREYSLRLRPAEGPARTLVVAISNAAFAGRHARYQDGPDICYQAIVKALASPAVPLGDRIALSEEDLYHYRCVNAPRTVRRGGAPYGPPRPPPR